MFDPLDPKQSFPALERAILQYWREEDIFRRSISERSTSHSFSFYDGPPFATGLPHYGHLLAGTIKDVIPRYKTMRGARVERRFGWDCHGLPIENLIEKEEKIESKREIEAMGVDVFNELCRGSVQRYTKEWRETVERMGRWVDMDADYRTMDASYMESIWWVFKSLAEKKLLYEGPKPMYVCTRCATALSNFEVTQGYRDRQDPSVIATFPLKEDPSIKLLMWTTTPWSLPGNMWLAIGKHIEYVLVESEGEKFVLAKKLLPTVFKKRPFTILKTLPPEELIGKRYEPLFPYIVDLPLPSTLKRKKPETYGERVFKVIAYDDIAVSDEEGTGIVHIASCLGEDSYGAAMHENVDILWHLGIDGVFAPFVTDFAGELAKPPDDPSAMDRRIIEKIKEHGRSFDVFTLTHSYPHCWRCDTPLIPYTTASWFVKVEKVKEKMLAANAQTEWVPSHIRDGRFGKWLQGARDWAISRKRYWGTPLPVWKCEETGEVEVLGSRDDLFRHIPDRLTKITVLRHGESEGNLVPIYQGTIPGTPLTDAGKKQAEEAGRFLAATDTGVGNTLPVTVIYCSPIERAQRTAEIVAKACGAKLIVDERLRELNMGPHEGKTIPQSDLDLKRKLRKKNLAEHLPYSIFHLEGMESHEQVKERMESFLHDILPKHRGTHVAIVSHGDPILVLRHLMTKEDPHKIAWGNYPQFASPESYYFDHQTKGELNLHKHIVDGISWKDAKGNVFKRITDVLDCWFESGSMPYAQRNYPFNFRALVETLDHSEKIVTRGVGKVETRDLASLRRPPPGFPADFIAEGIDQTRGWFYTLTVLSAALFDGPSFHHCIVNGIVLAEDGHKMSKRLKNYPEPTEVVEQFGADAVRFALMSSPAVRGEDLRFSAKVVEETVRRVLLPLWNTASFFVTYANAANFTPTVDHSVSRHPLDLYITSEVQDLVNRMTEQLDHYDLSQACDELFATIDALTNWYIRLSRRRFAGKDSIASADVQHALQTLFDVLVTMGKLLAPFCPFMSEAMYQNLVAEPHGSVHLTMWPNVRSLTEDEEESLRKNHALQTITTLGGSIRSERKLKARQPLARATIALPLSVFDVAKLTREDRSLLEHELNVKALTITDDPTGLATAVAMVDARKVGPRLGKKVQEVIAAGKRGEFTQGNDGSIVILGERLEGDEVQVVYRGDEGTDTASDHGIVVQLATTLTDELVREGEARDLIRQIQNLRKDLGCDVSERIVLTVDGLDDVLALHRELIEAETNATIEKITGGGEQRVEVGDGRMVNLGIHRK